MKPVWISFKYEKLTIVCYKCGMLTHDTKSCKTIKNKKEQIYGSWLRAEDSSVWTDSAAVEGDYMLVSVPENMEQPLEEGEAVETVDSSPAFVPTVTSVLKSKEKSGFRKCFSGGKG